MAKIFSINIVCTIEKPARENNQISFDAVIQF